MKKLTFLLTLIIAFLVSSMTSYALNLQPINKQDVPRYIKPLEVGSVIEAEEYQKKFEKFNIDYNLLDSSENTYSKKSLIQYAPAIVGTPKAGYKKANLDSSMFGMMRLVCLVGYTFAWSPEARQNVFVETKYVNSELVGVSPCSEYTHDSGFGTISGDGKVLKATFTGTFKHYYLIKGSWQIGKNTHTQTVDFRSPGIHNN